MVIGPLVLLPQLLEWREVYGVWLTIPQGEGFLQFPPAFTLKVLFSSQNGWFVWTPVTAIGVVGLLVGLRRCPMLFSGLLVALIAEIVLVGGVRTWHGHWFGLRYLTSLAALVAAGIFCLACSVRRRGAVVVPRRGVSVPSVVVPGVVVTGVVVARVIVSGRAVGGMSLGRRGARHRGAFKERLS